MYRSRRSERHGKTEEERRNETRPYVPYVGGFRCRRFDRPRRIAPKLRAICDRRPCVSCGRAGVSARADKLSDGGRTRRNNARNGKRPDDVVTGRHLYDRWITHESVCRRAYVHKNDYYVFYRLESRSLRGRERNVFFLLRKDSSLEHPAGTGTDEFARIWTLNALETSHRLRDYSPVATAN